MTGPAEVVTRVARACWDDHRYCGHTLTELVGHETFLGLTFMAATGRRATGEERALLDALTVATAAADPRIWPLRITRLVAAYGSTTAGFVAGQLCVENEAIGPWVTGPAGELLTSARDTVGALDDAAFDAAATAWLGTRRRLAGYGVAFREQDERLGNVAAYLERSGRAGLPFWRTLQRLSVVVLRERGLRPNISMGVAAALLDTGITPPQAQVLINLSAANTFYANAIEGARQRSEVLRVLPVDSVRYVGRGPRPLPADR
jgi:hypothetical protein